MYGRNILVVLEDELTVIHMLVLLYLFLLSWQL